MTYVQHVTQLTTQCAPDYTQITMLVAVAVRARFPAASHYLDCLRWCMSGAKAYLHAID